MITLTYDVSPSTFTIHAMHEMRGVGCGLGLGGTSSLSD